LILNKIVEADMGELIKIATELIEISGKVDLVIIGNNDGKIVGAASIKALKNNIKINELIEEAAKILGGGGGGKPTLAQGAGPKSEKMQEAIDFTMNKLKNDLKAI
jgi:alanyl-tRNA synthetase